MLQTESIVDLFLFLNQEAAVVIIHFLFMCFLTFFVVITHLYRARESLLDLILHIIEHVVDRVFCVSLTLLHKCLSFLRGEFKRQDLGGNLVVRCHDISKVDISMAVLCAHDPMHMLIVLKKSTGTLHEF